MAFVTPDTPNLADFTTYVNAQGIPAGDAPSADWIQYAYDRAFSLVITAPQVPQNLYTMAVYSAGVHILFSEAPDAPGQTFFQAWRQATGVLSLTAGVSASQSDNGTSNSMAVPKGLADLSLSALDFAKSPYGRRYLAYAQQYGPTVVGIC